MLVSCFHRVGWMCTSNRAACNIRPLHQGSSRKACTFLTYSLSGSCNYGAMPSHSIDWVTKSATSSWIWKRWKIRSVGCDHRKDHKDHKRLKRSPKRGTKMAPPTLPQNLTLTGLTGWASAFHFDARIRPRRHRTHSHLSHVQPIQTLNITHHVFVTGRFWIYLTLLEDPVSLSVATEGTTVTKDKSDKMATRWRQDGDKSKWVTACHSCESLSKCSTQPTQLMPAALLYRSLPEARNDMSKSQPLAGRRQVRQVANRNTKRFSKICEMHWKLYWNNFWPVPVQSCF